MRRTGCGSGSTGVVLGPHRLPAPRGLLRRLLRSRGAVACRRGTGEALQQPRAVVITILMVQEASSTPIAVGEEEEVVVLAVGTVVCRLDQGGWAGYQVAQG